MTLGRIVRKTASFFGFSVWSDGREKVAFFIEYCRQYESKLKSLELDHEPDEIKTMIRLYEPQMRVMAKFSIHMHHALDKYPDEFVIDNISPAEREQLFFKAIEFADSHKEIYSRISRRVKLIKAFIGIYGKPSDASTRKLKAEVAGDYEMSETL